MIELELFGYSALAVLCSIVVALFGCPIALSLDTGKHYEDSSCHDTDAVTSSVTGAAILSTSLSFVTLVMYYCMRNSSAKDVLCGWIMPFSIFVVPCLLGQCLGFAMYDRMSYDAFFGFISGLFGTLVLFLFAFVFLIAVVGVAFCNKHCGDTRSAIDDV